MGQKHNVSACRESRFEFRHPGQILSEFCVLIVSFSTLFLSAYLSSANHCGRTSRGLDAELIMGPMSELAAKTCVPCRGGVPPLQGGELLALQKQVEGWKVVEEHHITKTFKFADFREALQFVNRVGELAEVQGHHPDIFLAWGKVEITIWTHKIDGLTESDFIIAAKFDQLRKP